MASIVLTFQSEGRLMARSRSVCKMLEFETGVVSTVERFLGQFFDEVWSLRQKPLEAPK